MATAERRHRRACSAMNEIGNADRQEVGRRLNNRAENSTQPYRRREWAMQRFRSMKTLQNSAQFMPRSTTISIRSAISSPAKLTNKDEVAHWPSGALSRTNGGCPHV
jgi:transposase-like protein